jgi:hypothetical protein
MSEQELWNEIEVDADAFDKLTTENGSQLSGLIRTTTSIQKDLKAAEGAVKRLKVERDRYLFDLIPAKMAETGMTKVEVEGNQVTLQQFVAFAHLRDIGAEDFIKNEISVRFGLNEDNKVKAVQADLDDRGFDTATRTWVEPMTLKKLLRERVEAGQEIDLEMFNGYVGTIAKIKGV